MTDRNETPKRVAIETEVPGTPDEVWDAIATGPGISAWFAPAEIDGREGGKVGFDMGSGTVEMSGQVTEWDPPRSLTYEEEFQPDADAPAGTLAHEWLVEARSGDTCIVRVVTSAFTGGADWSDELDQMREGWTAFLHNLRRYLTDFAGQACSSVSANGSGGGSVTSTWRDYADKLGIGSVMAGERFRSGGDAPPLAGVVDEVLDAKWHAGILVSVDEPAPGFGMLFVYGWQGQTHPVMSLYLFGDDASEAAARAKDAWHAFMDKHFPSKS